METIGELRAVCAALPHSRETFPFGPVTLVFKVGRKMYALTDISSETLSVSLKVRPQRGDELRAEYAAITPGYHLNKRHWVSVKLGDRVPAELARQLIAQSYELVLAGMTRAERAALSGSQG